MLFMAITTIQIHDKVHVELKQVSTGWFLV